MHPLLEGFLQAADSSLVKEAAPRWLKMLRQGGEMGEEVAQRLRIGDDAREILKHEKGVLAPHGLPKPGLAVPEGGAAAARPLFNDPTLTLADNIDLERAERLPAGRVGESLANLHSRRGLRDEVELGGMSENDRYALNINPASASSGEALLPPGAFAGVRGGAWNGRAAKDLLQLGDNPGLSLQAVMDPGDVEQLQVAIRRPVASLREGLQDRYEPPGEVSAMIRRKRDNPGASVTELIGPAALGRRDHFDRRQEIPDTGIHGMRAWYDIKDPGEQLGFPGMRPPPSRVGVANEDRLRKATRSLIHQALRDIKKEYQHYQPSLFHKSPNDPEEIAYAHYKRLATDRDNRNLEGLEKQWAEERAKAGPLRIAKEKTLALAPAPAQAQAPVQPAPVQPAPPAQAAVQEDRGARRYLLPGAVAGTALGGLALARHLRNKKQEQAEEVD